MTGFAHGYGYDDMLSVISTRFRRSKTVTITIITPRSFYGRHAWICIYVHR